MSAPDYDIECKATSYSAPSMKYEAKVIDYACSPPKTASQFVYGATFDEAYGKAVPLLNRLIDQ